MSLLHRNKISAPLMKKEFYSLINSKINIFELPYCVKCWEYNGEYQENNNVLLDLRDRLTRVLLVFLCLFLVFVLLSVQQVSMSYHMNMNKKIWLRGGVSGKASQ